MWYAKYTEPRTIELRPLQRPKLRSPDDLLIRVAYAGICDDDLLIYAMNERSLEWPGLAPTEGHEFSGIVLEAGENAAVNFRPGDRVSGLAWSFCGNCYYCKNGMESHCVNQTVTSTFATELVLNQRQVCRLPSSVSLKDGVFTDPITYCLHTSLHHIAHPPYPNVLIFGTTAMALITLQLAKLQGAATVVVVEQNVEKAALARSLGADQVIDPMAQNALSAAMELTGGIGYHVIYEMARHSPYLQFATKVLAYQGSVWLACMYESSELSLSELFMKEGAIRFFALAPYMLMEAMRIMPQLRLAPLVSRVFPFQQINEAFRFQTQPGSGKALLEITPPERLGTL